MIAIRSDNGGEAGTGEALHQARAAPRYEEFIWNVQREAGLATPEAAALVVRATLATLAERLRVEADESIEGLIADLSGQLPERLRKSFSDVTAGAPCGAEEDGRAAVGAAEFSGKEHPGKEFSMTEFYRRVGERTGVGLAEAERHARAAALTLDAAVSGKEVDRVRSRLPDEYEFLFV